MIDKIMNAPSYYQIFLVLGSLFILLFIISIIIRIVTTYDYWKRLGIFLCTYLDWHHVNYCFGKNAITSFDGCSLHGTCHICGKENLLQDSQGSWS